MKNDAELLNAAQWILMNARDNTRDVLLSDVMVMAVAVVHLLDRINRAERVYVVMHGSVPEQNEGLLRVWDSEGIAAAEAEETRPHVLPSGAIIAHTTRAARLVLEGT